MKGDLISVLGLISSAWGSSSQPRQLISYNYIACIIKLLINIKIIIFRAMGIKINQILGFSGQMRDLLMRVFFHLPPFS